MRRRAALGLATAALTIGIPFVSDAPVQKLWTGEQSIEVDPNAHLIHHCEEDEAQVVTPFGLACVAVDNITELTPEQFDGLRVIGDHDAYSIHPVR